MKMNEEVKKMLERMKELEEGFEYEEDKDDGTIYCHIKDKWGNKTLFYDDIMEAAAFIGIRNDDEEIVRKAFDGNHSLWEDIFGDAAEDVEILEIFGDNSVLCKVHTEHDYDLVVRVASYVEWNDECFDEWPAWKICVW